MVLAALGDIHGNAAALDAALREIDEAGIRTIVCTGDLAAGYPNPNEVIETLRGRDIPTVQGAQDKLTAALVRSHRNTLKRANADEVEAIQRAYDQLSSANVEYLRALPKFRTITIDGVVIYLCHGAPNAINEGIGEETTEQRLERYRENAHAGIVIGGMTHHPFQRLVEDTLFVNPGSIGYDKRGAAYAIISTEDEPWTAEFRSAQYNSESVEEDGKD